MIRTNRRIRAAMPVTGDLIACLRPAAAAGRWLPRHVGCLLVLVIDLEETGALALGLGDRLLLVAFRDLQDLGGAAAGVGDDAVGVGLRLVLQALEVGARRLHVAERV